MEDTTFDQFNLKEDLLQGIREAGFKTPSPIQELSIPAVLEGKDIIAQAHTGTGKTAAFCLPAIQKMDLNKGVELLVITPTRELASQVSDEIYRLGRHSGVRTVTICGGQSYTRQLKLLKNNVQVLTATPGRLIDLLQSKQIKKLNPSIVVLDEADEMLDMGFLDDIQEIFSYLPEEKQTLLFSATMPDPIKKLAKKILKVPTLIKTTGTGETTNSDIKQIYFVIDERERLDAMIRLLDHQDPEKTIVFCRTKNEVDNLTTTLVGRGYNARSLHGDMVQNRREEVMGKFRKGLFDILVATDVAARGLDISQVTHVFNYHIPFDSKSYVHRIGRTGRAGKTGTAITLVTKSEYRQLERFRRAIGTDMEHKTVPCLGQLRKNRILKLKDTLLETPVLEEAKEMIDGLIDDISLYDLSGKLLSFILGEQKESGPEFIGLGEKDLEALINSKGRSQKPNRRNRPPRKKPFNKYAKKGNYRPRPRKKKKPKKGE